VHIDYAVTSQTVMEELDPNHPDHCEGYAPIFQITIAPYELAGLLGFDHECPFDGREPGLQSTLLTILCRNQDLTDTHGPERLAFLHIQAEAVWVCLNIWHSVDPDPFAVLLKDHGFGGNWTTFGGAEGVLYDIAQQTVFPEYLLVAKGTEEWPNYEAVSDWTELSPGQQYRLFRNQITGFDD
jgi:hypothetical protein